jgi:FkbH-like protein
MTVERFDAARHASRAVQLLQKTNQFNLTTRRYVEKDLQELLAAGAWVYLAALQDRFGDYGRIALAIIRFDGPMPELDSFLMSCRAIGRKAETVLLTFLIERLQRLGFAQLRASFIPTERNQVSAGFLTDHGFKPVASSGQEHCYERDTRVPLPEAAKYFEDVRVDNGPETREETELKPRAGTSTWDTASGK